MHRANMEEALQDWSPLLREFFLLLLFSLEIFFLLMLCLLLAFVKPETKHTVSTLEGVGNLYIKLGAAFLSENLASLSPTCVHCDYTDSFTMLYRGGPDSQRCLAPIETFEDLGLESLPLGLSR